MVSPTYPKLTQKQEVGVLYSQTVVIPRNTLSSSPHVVTWTLTAGVIRHIWVRWRWGSGNLCGCRMLYQSFCYWPLALEEWFPSNPTPLDFAEDFEVSADTPYLTVEAYNLDEVWEHTLWVACQIERPETSEGVSAFAQFLEEEARRGKS